MENRERMLGRLLGECLLRQKSFPSAWQLFSACPALPACLLSERGWGGHQWTSSGTWSWLLRCKAVDRRAATLPNEYRQHARKIDREYGGVPDGVVGPVEAKLLSFPPLRRWVFGAWGEASEDVHILVKDLAMSRVKHQQQLDGRWRWSQRSEEAEVAMYTGQVRRLLSVDVVRGQARCLLDRLRGLGAGAAAAVRRREWAAQQEQRLRRERQAHILSLGQGHHALRRGQFFL